MPVQRGLCPNRPWRTSPPTPGPSLRTETSPPHGLTISSAGGVQVSDNRTPEDSAAHGHVPVLIDRCVELLAPALTRRHADGTGAVLVDATLGAGGHSHRFLTDFPGLRVVGLDRDPTPWRSPPPGSHRSATG